MLDIKPEIASKYPWAVTTRTETISIKRFDNIFSPTSNEVRMLKLDIQGFEDRVLAGATKSLPKITLIQLEAAFGGMYEKEPTVFDHAAKLAQNGFQIIDVQEAFRDDVGRVLQVDTLLERF
jgi:Methyltransferase FkbM domain